MEHYRVEVAQWVEPAKYELVLPVDRPYFVDAMVAMTRVRMSAGLSFGDVVSVNGVTYDLGDFA
jgi:hypothetical protein